MADHTDVQAAVDQLAEALALSVLVEDRRQHPVWWSTRGTVDQTRTSTILDRRVDPQAAEVIRQFGLDRAEGPVRTPSCRSAACGRAGVYQPVTRADWSAICGCWTLTER